MKTIILFTAIALTGLSAGLFYAWEVSVIPGTKRINDVAYIQVMQSINRAIINPAFMMVFLGTFFVQLFCLYQYRGTSLFVVILIATLVYFLGTILVTILGNVPLNNALDLLSLENISIAELTEYRTEYQSKWNLYHKLRTVFSVLSFVVFLITAFINQNN
ncbi:anthrone oxygenase family protein [Wenyingzhuangia sp. IMCC45574]